MNALVAELSFSFALSVADAEKIAAGVDGDRATALLTAMLMAIGQATLDDALAVALEAARTMKETRIKRLCQHRIGRLCECGHAWNPKIVEDENRARFEPCPRCGRSG